MSTLWHLRITSFSGISPGAMHYYAKLSNGWDEWEIYHLLTVEEAAALSLKDSRYSMIRNDYEFSEGEPTTRFDTEDLAKDAGIVGWQSVKEDGDILVYGFDAHSFPHDGVADGPPEFIERFAPLYERAVACDFYDGTEEQYTLMRAIAKEYDALLEEFDCRQVSKGWDDIEEDGRKFRRMNHDERGRDDIYIENGAVVDEDRAHAYYDRKYSRSGLVSPLAADDPEGVPS